MAQFVFNNNASITGISPFYTNYGKYPNISRDSQGLRPIVEKVKISIDRLKELYTLLQSELEWIAERTAIQANRKRSEGPDLKEGGMIYLLRKNIKTKRPSDKLDYTKLRLFKIKKKLGPVTFRLIMPKRMRIHLIFHISLLEPIITNANLKPIELDQGIQELFYKMEEIIDYQIRNDKPHYLIH